MLETGRASWGAGESVAVVAESVATRRTLPGLEICGTTIEIWLLLAVRIQMLHGCRQLVP